MMDYTEKYPHLFNEILWPFGPTKATFELFDSPPPAGLISNVNLIARNGNGWVVLFFKDQTWDILGGTLEPGETYMQTIHRELLEEAGAELLSFRIIGGWHCFSKAEQPYRPHLPFSEYYRVVGIGEIKLVSKPTNPPGAEGVLKVESVPMEIAITRFREQGRDDLIELYQLAAELSGE